MATNLHSDYALPGVYALLLLDVVSRWGYDDNALFSCLNITTEQLSEADCRLSIDDMTTLLNKALELTGEESLAFQLGSQMRISIHGFIGYAIMTATDISHALELATRFIQLRAPFIQFNISTFGQNVELQLQCELPKSALRNEIMSSLAIGVLSMAKALTGKEIKTKIELDYSMPHDFQKHLKHIHSEFLFDQPYMVTYFDKKYLSLPIVNADPISSQIAINQCESELSALGERRRFAMRVRDILSNTEQENINITAVAEQLHMSDRTLKRQLANEGTTFSNLVDEVRYRRAVSLLSRSDFSLDQISDKLGYSDVANFSRAFKRWSGRSPSNWRKDPYL